MRQIYFFPLIYALVFSGLAILLHLADQQIGDTAQASIFLMERSSAFSYYILVIGSLLTIVTITFSIMMVVLTIYGSQFSPRTLQDFMQRRITLQILALFIGNLMYSIVGYYLMSTTNGPTRLLSPTIGILFFVVTIFMFAYFINYVSRSVQINLFVQGLVSDSIKQIGEQKTAIDENPELIYMSEKDLEDLAKDNEIMIKADNLGYLEHYDQLALFAFAKENNCLIKTLKQVGDHVFEDDPVLAIYGLTEIDEKTEKQLLEFFVIDSDINLYQYLGANSKKLTEIALRALSPGINDPSTAAFCIKQIGYILENAAELFQPIVYIDKDRNVRVVIQKVSLTRYLYDHFSQLKLYGFRDMMIVRATLSAISRIAKQATYIHKKDIYEFALYMLQGIDLKSLHAYDYDFIMDKFYLIALYCNERENFVQTYDYIKKDEKKPE